MSANTATRWQDGRGFAVSVLLHLAAAFLFLWWHRGHQAPAAPVLPAMNVDLVAQPQMAPGPAGGSPAQHRAAVRTAPVILGQRPKAVTPAPDALEARIAGLATLTAPSGVLGTPDNEGAGGGAGAGGGYALADYVRAQILRRWWPALSDGASAGMPVALKLTMSRTGVLSNIRILDQVRFNTDKVFRGMALSARNAALNASPIALPPGRYEAMTEISITLDPRAVLR